MNVKASGGCTTAWIAGIEQCIFGCRRQRRTYTRPLRRRREYLAGFLLLGFLVVTWVRKVVPDIDDELVPVGGKHSHRDPHRPLVLIESGAEYLKNCGVVRDTKERLLVGV